MSDENIICSSGPSIEGGNIINVENDDIEDTQNDELYGAGPNTEIFISDGEESSCTVDNILEDMFKPGPTTEGHLTDDNKIKDTHTTTGGIKLPVAKTKRHWI